MSFAVVGLTFASWACCMSMVYWHTQSELPGSRFDDQTRVSVRIMRRDENGKIREDNMQVEAEDQVRITRHNCKCSHEDAVCPS